MTFNSNKWATSLSSNSNGNGRGLDNTSAQAARRLGYTVTGASTTNKFVEVRGRNGTTLVGFYGQRRWGGFQLEFSSAAIAEEAAEKIGCEMAADSNGRRIAVGFTDRELAEALEFVIGAPEGAKAKVTEVQAPAKATQVPTTALIDAELAAAMVEVEEEEAVPVSRKDEVTAQLKALGKSEAFIQKVLAKMGL
jgi:hypothetical protein